MRRLFSTAVFAAALHAACMGFAAAPTARNNADALAVTDQDRQHWAFRRVQRPNVPDAKAAATPIDAFLLVRLNAQHLTFSPPADAAVLLRRAFLDLHGLPPSVEEVRAFLADSSADAFARQVDRLLASPRFGERWGRHWLDVVGYADTVGFDGDANNLILSEGKWKYRDYVIDAFNADKPYDRFLTEQIAGDELVDWRHAPRFTKEIRDDLIATGYLRTARDQTHEPESNIPLSYYGVLHDTVEVVGNSLFALTLNCARCHSHKFDPLPQRDYYRMMALFTPAYNPANWKPVFPWKPQIKDRGLPDVSPAEADQIERDNAVIDRDVAAMKARMAKPGCTPDLAATLKNKIAERAAQRRHAGRIQALYDVGPAPVTHLLVRGEFERPGPPVEPGFLSVLCDSEAAAVVRDPRPSGPDSRRRTAFARWVTKKNSRSAALVARVMVNRIWQHLFGEGLVRTPENFGLQGEAPSHPELLEWLSAEFMNGAGWRVKPLIRKMMLSEAYRQSSQMPASAAGKKPASADPENRLLWRMRPKRLEAEAIRDCVLAVSGRLDSTMGGPPVLLVARPDGLVVVDRSKIKRPADADKRSIYLLSRRSFNLSLLTVFDRPLFTVNCPKRDASVIPLQSLTMLNDAFIAEEAEHFADRIGPADGQAVDRALRAAFARGPNDVERRLCEAHLRRQRSAFRAAGASDRDAGRLALIQLCHTLFNASEFLYAE